jgi:polyisoprenoid-binding protein YceI
MKKNVIVALGVIAISLVSLTTIDSNKGKAEAYKLDSKKTSLQWTGKYVSDGHTHTGTVNVTEGNLTLGSDKSVKGTFTVDMKSIVNQDLPDEKKGYLVGHLNSPDFFNTEKYTTAKVTVKGIKDNVMDATITVLGKEIPATIPVTVENKGKTMTAKGKFEVDFAALEMGGTKPATGKPENERADSKIAFDLNLVMTK